MSNTDPSSYILCAWEDADLNYFPNEVIPGTPYCEFHMPDPDEPDPEEAES